MTAVAERKNDERAFVNHGDDDYDASGKKLHLEIRMETTSKKKLFRDLMVEKCFQ